MKIKTFLSAIAFPPPAIAIAFYWKGTVISSVFWGAFRPDALNYDLLAIFFAARYGVRFA